MVDGAVAAPIQVMVDAVVSECSMVRGFALVTDQIWAAVDLAEVITAIKTMVRATGTMGDAVTAVDANILWIAYMSFPYIITNISFAGQVWRVAESMLIHFGYNICASKTAGRIWAIY